MSDQNAEMEDNSPEDPFAPEAVEDTIAASLRRDAPTTASLALVSSLADAYTLLPAADAILARSRATLARRAAALGGGKFQSNEDLVTLPASSPVATSAPAQHGPYRVPGWLDFAVIALLFALVVVAALVLLGPQVARIFNNVNSAL